MIIPLETYTNISDDIPMNAVCQDEEETVHFFLSVSIMPTLPRPIIRYPLMFVVLA